MDKRATGSTLFRHISSVISGAAWANRGEYHGIYWLLVLAAICCKNAENGWNTSARTNKNAEDRNELEFSVNKIRLWLSDNRELRKSINNSKGNAAMRLFAVNEKKKRKEKDGGGKQLKKLLRSERMEERRAVTPIVREMRLHLRVCLDQRPRRLR